MKTASDIFQDAIDKRIKKAKGGVVKEQHGEECMCEKCYAHGGQVAELENEPMNHESTSDEFLADPYGQMDVNEEEELGGGHELLPGINEEPEEDEKKSRLHKIMRDVRAGHMGKRRG